MEKIKVISRIPYDIEGLLSNKEIADLVVELHTLTLSLREQEYTNVTLHIDHHYDYIDIFLEGMRWETDDELAIREKTARANLLKEEKALEKKRKQYEKLKKEFEG